MLEVHTVHLSDNRRFKVPNILYEHIRESGFRHGIKWARAHPDEDLEQ